LFKDWYISNWVKNVAEEDIESQLTPTMLWFVGFTLLASIVHFIEEVRPYLTFKQCPYVYVR